MMAAEMRKTAEPPLSRRLAVVVDQAPSHRPAGCGGVFFRLLDWNRRLSGKKIFPPRLLSHPKSSLPHPKLLMADENRGRFSAGERKMCSPNLVARLMGLDSMPTEISVSDISENLEKPVSPLKKTSSDLLMEAATRIFEPSPPLENLPELGDCPLSSLDIEESIARRNSSSKSNDPPLLRAEARRMEPCSSTEREILRNSLQPRAPKSIVKKPFSRRRKSIDYSIHSDVPSISVNEVSVSGSSGDLNPGERIQRKKTMPDSLGVLLEQKIKELSDLGRDESVAGVLEELISALTSSPFSEPEVIQKNDPSPKISHSEEEFGVNFGRCVLEDALERFVDFPAEVQSDHEELKPQGSFVDVDYSQRVWGRIPQMVAYKVNVEMESWGRMAGKGLDEIVRWDLNRTAEKCVDSVDVEIDNLVLELLVKEVVLDLLPVNDVA